MAFRFSRMEIVSICFCVLFFLLAARLVYLQGIVGKELAVLGLMGRMHELKADALRGTIFDRNMEPLTGRSETLSVVFFPGQCKDREAAIAALLPFAEMPEEVLRQTLLSAKRPVRLLDHITQAAATAIAAAAPEGVVVSAQTQRYSALASHLIGYVSRSDNHGVSGLEASYDASLQDSGQMYLAAIADARAVLIPGLRYREIRLQGQRVSQSLVLTVDARLQKKTEEIFDRYAKKGAVVVMEPYTGEIRAMVSRPNFNAQQLEQYLDDADAPLLNRAISAYQPGSVFKLAIAAAALEAGIVTPQQKFFDRGYIDVDGTIFHGWDYKKGAREISFVDAVADSSNPVFIETGLKLGMPRLLPFLRKLGFGQQTPLALYGESAGNLPDASLSYRGETANLSIGQGQCEATPLQVAALVATIVNDGVKVEPILVDRILDGNQNLVNEKETAVGVRVFSAQTAKSLRSMMEAVTRRGTGQAAFVARGGSAGKTGSAETGRVDKAGGNVSHAWFAGYAPLNRPAYVAVVFVEEGMSGGDVAAPIFRALMEAFAADDVPPSGGAR